MNTAIHPYKGYLNTSFHLYVRGENPLAYDVYNNEQKKSSLIFSGSANPNQPCKIKMPQSGVYTIKFSNGESHKIQVIDGYKYGGNKLKRAFVFDECNWAFVIMHDRTYFYNRQNKLSFVEAISPDEIEVVSADYVLFKNSNQEELTLFSLEEQKPILWLKNVEFYSSKAIVWLEDNHNEDNDKSAYTLNTYNLSEQRLVKILCKDFTFEKKHESLLFYTENNISRLNFSNFEITPVECECKNLQFTTFVGDHFAIYTNNDQSILTLFDLYNDENRGKIFVNGTLARVNNHVLINVDERTNTLRNFDFNSFILPESKICTSYIEYDFYPQDWVKSAKEGDIRTLYKETVTNLSASRSKHRKTNIERTTKCFIKSFETDFSQLLQNKNGKVVYRENCFVFYNETESLTIPRYYPRSIRYQKGARIMLAGNVLLMVCDDAIYRLNKNGFWEHPILGKYDTSLLEEFHVIKNIEDKSWITLNGFELGHLKCKNNLPTPCLNFDSTIVYPGGGYLIENVSLHAVSSQTKYGLSVTSEKVEFFNLHNHKVKSSNEILEDIFDYSKYQNVLLSEDGKHIIYRDGNQTRMLNLAIGESIDFDNLSFIKHINGIRPLFRVSHNSQAILINPINGLRIENKLVNEYCFVSPDYKFYADKDINKYIEYYDNISKRTISSEEYVQLKSKLEYKHIPNNAHDEIIKNNRTNFIQRNFDFFCELDAFKEKREEDILNTLALRNLLYNQSFVDLFIEKKGVAVIRKVADKSEYLRVPLGLPLWFLNYVSFSMDSKYVAIAGRYPNDSGYSGLFLVYNIQKREPVIVEKSSYAVWTTAFNNDNVVAAYTSCPNSFVGNVYEYKKCENSEIRYRDKAFNVRDYNFLTFSPNGKYFACSQQGYICYNKTDDTINQNWGHQPSSIVSIRLSTSPDRELIVFDDLSELGIADVNAKISVASVSFSNDNQHIMMVGNDGVVVVRNLYLKENFEYDEYESDEYNYDTDYGTHYGEYAGSYAQDIMGYSDDVINDAFDGDPDAYWNID